MDYNRRYKQGHIVKNQLNCGVETEPRQFIPINRGKPRINRDFMSVLPASQIFLPKSWRHGLTLPSEKLFITQENRTASRRERDIEDANCI